MTAGALLPPSLSAPPRAVLNAARSRAYCSVSQHVQPAWWPKRFTWESVQVLDLVPGPAGTGSTLIAAQDIITKPSTLLRPLPLLGWAYEGVARRAAALAITAGVWAAGAACGQAAAASKAAVVALGGDAGPAPGSRVNGPRNRLAGKQTAVQRVTVEPSLPLSSFSSA